MDVLCRGCGGRYHETTEKFDPSRPANGGMLRLKDKYRAFGWSAFPEHDGTGIGDLECPECGTPYCYNARVKVDEDESRGPRGTDATDERIQELHAAGMKPGDIAKAMGLNHHSQVTGRLRAMRTK